MTLYRIWQRYQEEPWYQPIHSHISVRYQAIVERMIQSFNYVTPDKSNRSTHSYVFASILRDVGSTFDSVVWKLIENTGSEYRHDIYGYLKFLETLDPELENRTILMVSNMKTLLPFKKGEKGIQN